jgi:hypothetical protein
MITIYKLKNYSVKYNGCDFNCEKVRGRINQIEEELILNNSGYHLRLKNDEKTIFFGDIDNYKKNIEDFKDEIKEYFEINKLYINLEQDFVYTQNEGYTKEGKSFHFSIPKYYSSLKK